MIFLTETDFISHLSENILDQITNNNSDLMDMAETKSIAILVDLMSGMYDIESVISNTQDRNQIMVIWLLSLASYFLYSSIPDNEVPERIVKDYDDTMQNIRNIARGKQPTTLPPVTLNGLPKRAFRMGSNSSRNHNLL